MLKGTALALISLVLISTGCSKKTVDQQPELVKVTNKPIINKPERVLLSATAFQMSGDYGNNVAVTLNMDGSFAYYPDPADLTKNSRPVDLGNGWWLNRQGITSNSVFTKYTFDEYSKLEKVPSQEELKASIIPGATVTRFEKLPFPSADAMDNLDSIKTIVSKK